MPTLHVGDRLPNLRLPRAGDEVVRPLRGVRRDAAVVVALHDPACDVCRDYLRTLAGAASDFRVWDGRVRAVTDAEAGADGAVLQAELGSVVDVLVDADQAFLDRLDRTTGPVTLVADRYGQVYHIEGVGQGAVTEAGDGHPVMEPRELAEWLKYLATQCPE